MQTSDMRRRTVRYLNWWREFDPSESFIPRLIAASVGESLQIVEDPQVHVDIEVHSVFTNSGIPNRLKTAWLRRSRSADVRRTATLKADYGIGTKGPASHHIWYTGENLRPPADWDVTLSFDLDPFLGANWYLPHWAIRLGDLGDHDPHDAFQVSNSDLIASRSPTPSRKGFAVVLAGNPHPTRSILLQALNQIAKVDTYGAAFGRPIDSKLDLLRRYRFAVVPENDLYPGYVTEKIVEAWLAGCVPIWWGSDPAGFLNGDALVNASTLSLKNLVNHVRDLESDPDRMRSMTSQPILLKPYDFEGCVDFIQRRLQIATW